MKYYIYPNGGNAKYIANAISILDGGGGGEIFPLLMIIPKPIL